MPIEAERRRRCCCEAPRGINIRIRRADIATICNKAALIVVRADKNKVVMVDFEQETDRVIGGLEKEKK